MKQPVLVCFVILVVISVGFSFFFMEQKTPEPVAHDGILDLRNWDFERNGSVLLKGAWKFKWMADDLAFRGTEFNDTGWDNFKVPQIWNKQTGKALGYGWFRLKLILNKNSDLAIYCYPVICAHEMYLNGELFLNSGIAGNNKLTTIARRVPLMRELPKMDTITLAWKISSFDDHVGGPNYAPEIGLSLRMQQQSWLKDFLASLAIGVLLISSIYHFLIWYGRNKERANLYFSLLCCLLAIRMLAVDHFIERIFWDYNVNTLRMKLAFFSPCLAWFFLQKYFQQLFPNQFRSVVYKFLGIIAIVLSVIVLVTPPLIFTSIIGLMHLLEACGIIMVIISLTKALKGKEKYAKRISVATGICFAGSIHDVLVAEWFIRNTQISDYGMIIFIFSQAMILSFRNANAHQIAEHLSENLQEEVKKQTRILKQQTERLEETNMQLKELDRHKNNFIQNITHEFRTPLTLILDPLQVIISEWKPEKNVVIRDDLKRIYRNAKRLFFLINQLLELVKIDGKKVKLSRESVDIILLLEDIRKSFYPMAKKRSIRLQFSSTCDSYHACVDPEKFERIVYNLLSNAFKFTCDNDFITISFRITLQMVSDKPMEMMEISIADSGIGIPEAEFTKIFERFYQVDSSLTRNAEGIGIGLAIVKQYVELHGGIVHVNSKEGEGSEFVVSIPAVAVDADLNDHLNRPIPQASRLETEEKDFYADNEGSHTVITEEIYPDAESFRYKILVAEDNPDMRNYIRRILAPEFYVYEAENGIIASGIALEKIPDLIISDIMMPKMDGIELCRLIKTDKKTNHIPIILLTAKTSESDAIISLNSGADDHISKPFSSKLLIARIHNLLSLREKLSQQYVQKIMLEPSGIITESSNELFIRKIMEVVENNLDNENFDVTLFSQEIGMSHVHLYRKMDAILGQSPSDFIRILRLKKAAQYLACNAKSNLMIADIAYKVGFKNTAHFSKCFKQQFKLSPTEYSQKFEHKEIEFKEM